MTHAPSQAPSDPSTAPSPTPPPAWTPEDLAANPHASADKAKKVRDMFTSIAPSYDLNNRLHSFGRDQAWRRAAVRLSEVRPTDSVLDVATGSGDLAFAFARAGADPVIGLDFTPRMLHIARRRARKHAVNSRITFIEGDAQNLPLAPGSVDVISIAFGIRNVADPAIALSEFHRVLRPGGRLIILEFSQPAFVPIAWMSNLYCTHIMPRTATLISRDRSGAYHYLPRSIDTFLKPEELENSLKTALFSDVQAHPLTFGVCTCYRAVKRQ